VHCRVTLIHRGTDVEARCAEFPGCEGRGATRSEALAKLRSSVVFWLEACPCDTTADQALVLDVVEERGG